MALAEAEVKGSDLFAAVKCASALHQRYSEFTVDYISAVTDQYEECKDVKKSRILFRHICLLSLAGLMQHVDGEQYIKGCAVRGDGGEAHGNSLLLHKYCGKHFLGITPESEKKMNEQYLKCVEESRRYNGAAVEEESNGSALQFPEPCCLVGNTSYRNELLDSLASFYESLKESVMKVSKSLKACEEKSRKEEIMRGEVTPKTQEQLRGPSIEV